MLRDKNNLEDYLKNTENLTDLVINKRFSTKLLFDGQKIINQVTDTKQLIQPTKEFKGVCTDLIVNDFLKTPDQIKQFIKLIIETFEKAISYYEQKKGLEQNSIIILYKGGNILRFVASESMRALPKTASDKIIDYYKPYFKRSDADFVIYINPKLHNFDDIIEDITNLSFLLQNQIRNVFLQNMDKYFEYYRLSVKEREKILNQVLKKLNETETVKEKMFGFDGKFSNFIFNNIKVGTDNFEKLDFISKRDFEIGFENPTGDGIKYTYTVDLLPIHLVNPASSSYNDLKFIIDRQIPIYDQKINSELFMSVNKTLKFKDPAKLLTSFRLTRTKITFGATFEYFEYEIKEKITKYLKLDGELMDVSIVDKADSGLEHFYTNSERFVANYSIGTDADKFNFKAYSLEYLIEDLEYILFDEVDFPWTDTKYEKRIRRLLYMYFIVLLINPKINNKIRIEYLTFIKINITDKIAEIFKTDSEATKGRIKKELLKNITHFLRPEISKDKEEKKYPFRELVKNIARTLLNIKAENLDKFKNYDDILSENLILMIEALNDYEQFIKNDGTFKRTSLYEGKALGGGKDYYSKYLKYKSRYYNL